MKKFLLILCMFVTCTFAGNWQRASDTSRVDSSKTHTTTYYSPEYYYYPTTYPTRHSSITVVYERTAPRHCVNVNCRVRYQPAPPKHRVVHPKPTSSPTPHHYPSGSSTKPEPHRYQSGSVKQGSEVHHYTSGPLK